MNYNLCVHVDMNDEAIAGLALGNIANYKAALQSETFRVRLVANGGGVCQFRADAPHAAKIAELKAAGVEFAVCTNALKKFEIAQDAVHPACEIIPAGVVELVVLQREGFAYIKP